MDMREKIEKQIARKQAEIEALRSQIAATEAYIQGQKDILKMMPTTDRSEVKTSDLRPGTDLAKARDAIKKAGKPLYIVALLEAIGKEPTKNHRVSLSGSLAWYVRRNQVFTRPAPNTFGLCELEAKQDDGDSRGEEEKNEASKTPLQLLRSGAG